MSPMGSGPPGLSRPSAASFPGARPSSARGPARGTIGWEPKGEDGFGYDPVFVRDGKTYSQMTGAEKDAVSHRGAALRLLYDQLNRRLNGIADQ